MRVGRKPYSRRLPMRGAFTLNFGNRLWRSWEECTAFHFHPTDQATFLSFRKNAQPAFTLPALGLEVVSCMETQIRFLRDLYNDL